MKLNASGPRTDLPARVGRVFAAALLVGGSWACSSGEVEIPTPRPVVIRSGVRLYPDLDRLKAIDTWYRAQQAQIQNDPSFWVITVPRDTPSYPWESLVLVADTAKIGVERGFDEANRVFMIYAHDHLMKKLGRIDEVLPGGENLEGFQLERAILARVSDAWFLGRSVYQVEAFDPLEEILYANENGYLDAMILTARGDEFPEEREAWLEEDPGAMERYREWFMDTFSREPPGLRGEE